jgi:hypothetical protein
MTIVITVMVYIAVDSIVVVVVVNRLALTSVHSHCVVTGYEKRKGIMVPKEKTHVLLSVAIKSTNIFCTHTYIYNPCSCSRTHTQVHFY